MLTRSLARALVILSLASPALARADVKLPAFFSNHMVLQQASTIPIWGSADPGEKITITLAGQSVDTTADATGHWKAALTPLKPAEPLTMTLTGKNKITISDILIGEVWLASGQSNMDFPMLPTRGGSFGGPLNAKEEAAAANYPQIRYFRAAFTFSDTPTDDVKGEWRVCTPDNVAEFSAAAYFFARDIHKDLKFPVGILQTSFGASTAEAWVSRDVLAADPKLNLFLEAYAKAVAAYTPEALAKAQAAWQARADAAKAAGTPIPKKPNNANPHTNQHNPTVLYNAMLHPIAPYAIKGFLWYQGESNGPSADRYTLLMTALIKNWRDDWHQSDLPFIFVQIAAYKPLATTPDAGGTNARVREAQLLTLAVPHTAMATAIDIGDATNIHPKNKQEIGHRLALAAQAIAYGEKIPYSGPIFDHMDIEKSAIRLHFTHVDGGLASKDGGKLTGFAICGKEGKWAWANVTIDGETLLATSPDVPEPTTVRYGWADNPPVNLINKAGLPASPFRTDMPHP